MAECCAAESEKLWLSVALPTARICNRQAAGVKSIRESGVNDACCVITKFLSDATSPASPAVNGIGAVLARAYSGCCGWPPRCSASRARQHTRSAATPAPSSSASTAATRSSTRERRARVAPALHDPHAQRTRPAPAAAAAIAASLPAPTGSAASRSAAGVKLRYAKRLTTRSSAWPPRRAKSIQRRIVGSSRAASAVDGFIPTTTRWPEVDSAAPESHSHARTSE